MFIPLTKVDTVERLVYGKAADETPDLMKEIFDYDSSKPFYEAWSENASKTSDGKSLGNVRAMHGKVAAGKLTVFDLQDSTKTIEVAAKIVDDNEWEKVMEGVYTGFSVGGSYVRKWADAALKGFKRYTHKPLEISLADLPCNPSATFEAVKAAGEVEQIAFKVAPREDVNPKEGKEKYGDVEFADEKNKKYPLDTKAHVRAAASYFGMPKNREKYSAEDQKKIDAKIEAAKKKFKIGEHRDKSGSKLARGFAEKNLMDVGDFARILVNLGWMYNSVKAEAEFEKDESDLPERLADVIDELCEIFTDMAEEEAAELVAAIIPVAEQEKQTTTEGGKVMDIEALKTMLGEANKSGARHSKETKDALEGIHKSIHEAHKLLGGAKDACKALMGVKDADAEAKAKKEADAGAKDDEKDKTKKDAVASPEIPEEVAKIVLELNSRLEKAEAGLEAANKTLAQPRSAGAGKTVEKTDDQVGAKDTIAEPKTALEALKLAKERPMPFQWFKNASGEAVAIASGVKAIPRVEEPAKV